MTRSFNNLPIDQNGHLFTDKQTVSGINYGGRLIHSLSAAARCAVCSVWADGRIVEGTFLACPTPCPYPNGITTTIDLNVPSGEIVVADDLRPIYNGFGDEDYNTSLGQHQVIEAFAAQGCAFGPVGNTCPGLYRTGPDTYVIASPRYDEEKGDVVLPDGWTWLAGIVTDLFAYSIADYVDFVTKGGSTKDGDISIVEVGAGTYRFAHHTGEQEFDRDAEGDVIFADIERIVRKGVQK